MFNKIKTLVKKLFIVLFGRFTKRHESKINSAQKWIDTAQANFANAVQEAQIAEEKFDEVIADAEKKKEKLLADIEKRVSDLQSTVDDTKVRKQQATNFKNKIQTFLD